MGLTDAADQAQRHSLEGLLRPAQRSKTKVAHILPLGPLAWEIIEAQPRNGSDYVFGCRPVPLPHQKRKLAAAMPANAPWLKHCLRRSAHSLMARARVDSETAERMIGHLPRGLIRTYDVYDRVTEKRDGFAKLEREIDLILNPAPAAVVAFRR